jgi:hypothetical protein
MLLMDKRKNVQVAIRAFCVVAFMSSPVLFLAAPCWSLEIQGEMYKAGSARGPANGYSNVYKPPMTSRNDGFQAILYAELYPGGVPGAVRACPRNGCMIYAVSPLVNRNLGEIDPGNKAITIYLGPYAYSVKQITLRRGFKIIGMGASGGNEAFTCTADSSCNGTTLQSVNGNSPVFVLPQSNNTPASNVLLSGFRLLGSTGNTKEDGFLLDTSSTVNSGLWYSTLRDIYIEGFAGVGIHVLGHSDNFGSLTQWVDFDHVVVFRTISGGNALRLEGATFELRFTDCEFDGQAVGDGTDIYIGARSGGVDGYPLSITFEGLVAQAAAKGVQIDGAVDIRFYGSHHEKLCGAYQVDDDLNVWTKGLTISDSYFANNVGVNNGAGYLLDITTSLATGISFVRNRIDGTPDSVVQGTNLASVNYQDNFYGGTATVPPTSGITTQVQPASSIDVRGAHSIGLNPSTVPITTIQSSLGPGETVTFFCLAGPVTFGPGGNIDLMGASTLTVNGSITFIRDDLMGGLQWVPVSQWSPPPASTPQ